MSGKRQSQKGRSPSKPKGPMHKTQTATRETHSSGRQAVVVKEVVQAAQKVSTAQTLSLKQSNEIVQTLMHGAISSLIYLRGLLPESCFKDQYLATSETALSYESYAAGVRENSPGKGGCRVKALMKGRSTRADTLLEWLEKGVFDALHKGYLRVLQISLFADPEHEENVLEVYNFSIRYKDGASPTDRPSEVEMTGRRGNGVTVMQARTSMQAVVRGLVQLCGTMPALPEQRYLKLYLFYNDKCPKDYEPPGTWTEPSGSIKFPDCGWEKITTRCGELNAGSQSVSLQVTHLESPVDEEDLPNDLTYSNPCDRFEDIDSSTHASNQERDTMDGQTSGPDAMEGAEATSFVDPDVQSTQESLPTSVHGGDDPEAVRDSASPDELETGSELQQHQPVNKMTTSPRKLSAIALEDLREREQLQRMLRSSVHLNDTQEVQHPDNVMMGVEDNQGSPPISAMQLSQTTINRLKSRPSIEIAQRAASLFRRSGSSAAEDEETVDCSCGFNRSEGDMMRCAFCGAWQHPHCYGFKGREDPRRAEDHACYKCLLQPHENDTIERLEKVAGYRRCLYHLEKHGFDTEKQLASVLGCKAGTVNRLLKHLRDAGLLVEWLGPRQSQGVKKISLSKADGVARRVMQQYFDPMLHVAHHFELPTPPTAMFAAERDLDSLNEETAPTAPVVGPAMVTPATRKRQWLATDFSNDPAPKRRGFASGASQSLDFAALYTPSPGR
ncbi:HORMA domain-containing protein [Massariosphaeria phaeospora]|uniref:HORMA domain-containing protein n=1 Tax=Massariosphaeria phaeospora TaxID=100035 RepID=A0A7C8M370_9PLEO|nr:HORMA domain-containing protein [Massariosphaeria phaeospora]